MTPAIPYASVQDAIRTFRHVGEVAARGAGLQPCDADAVGVDFAAYMVTRPSGEATRDTAAYVVRAARWFAAKEARRLRRSGETAWQALPSVEELPAGNIEGDPASIFARKQACEEVRHAVHRLPREDQAVLRLFLVEETPATEAASQLGCTPAAARKRLQRIRGHLRRLLVNS